MKVKIRRVVNRFEATPAELAADYKFRGLDKCQAWDRFVIDRNLRPEIDAKGFYLGYRLDPGCHGWTPGVVQATDHRKDVR